MERPNFVENGGFKLPIGYRFHPTDEELVVHYLKRKVLGLPMPASVIPEFDVFQNDPSSLPGLSKIQILQLVNQILFSAYKSSISFVLSKLGFFFFN
jgi:hypothetical protein